MGKIKEWKQEIVRHRGLILISIVFLVIAIILNYLSGVYVEKKEGAAVSDVILDNIPPIDVDFLFVWGFIIILAVFLIYPLFFRVKELHVAISQFSILVLIRSFFVSLTHLKTPIDAISIAGEAPRIFSFLDFQNALFFSGHTAVPFLGYLLYRKEKIGIFFLISTIVMAATVLLMHVHYSIDVFAAIFITYGSYKIGKWLFTKINHY